MIYFICIIHSHIFHRNIWTQNWPAPNVSGFIAQLVERRTGIARSRVQAPLKSWIFFRLLYAIVKIAIITARIILHLISYPQFTYDLFHMHHSLTYLSREHMNPKLTCSQRQWLQLVERRTGIARSRVQAPLKSWIFFRLLYVIVKIAIITARIILHLISCPQFTYDLFHMHHSEFL